MTQGSKNVGGQSRERVWRRSSRRARGGWTTSGTSMRPNGMFPSSSLKNFACLNLVIDLVVYLGVAGNCGFGNEHRGIVKAVQSSSFGGSTQVSFSSSSDNDHPAVGGGVATEGGEPGESVLSAAAGGSDEDMASEAGSEYGHRRHFSRRHLD